MYLKREIDRHLEAWASESGRKPLLLRGARQIGKTTAVMICAMASLRVFGEWLGDDAIKSAATRWLAEDRIAQMTMKGLSPESVTSRDALRIVSLSPAGYIVFSGSDLTGPVISFSPNVYSEPEEGSPFYDMLAFSSESVAKREAEGGGRTEKWTALIGGRDGTKPTARRLLTSSPDEDTSTILIEPFVTTHWNQWQPWNDFCPIYNSDGSGSYRGRCPCGCVATAVAQQIAHFKWPWNTGRRDSYVHTFNRDGEGDPEESVCIRFDGHVPFEWNLMLDTYSWWGDARGHVDELERYPIGRFILWVDHLTCMNFGKNGSGSHFSTVREPASDWYEWWEDLDLVNDYDVSAAKIKADFEDRVPVHVGVPGHSVVAHGWASDDEYDYVYLNYGWGGSSDGWYILDGRTADTPICGAGVGFRPKKKVQLEPLPKVSDNDVTVKWHLPQCYDGSVTGFEVEAVVFGNQVGDEICNFTDSAGVASDPTRIFVTNGVEEVRNDTDFLWFGSWMSGTYDLPGERILTSGSTLSYRVSSADVGDRNVEILASFDGGEWQTVSRPILCRNYWTGSWISQEVFLGEHAGENVRFRIKVGWSGGSVRFDDFTVSDVIQPSVVFRKTVEPELRAYTVSEFDRGVLAGISVTPIFPDGGGIKSERELTRIAGSTGLPVPATITEYTINDFVYTSEAANDTWCLRGTAEGDSTIKAYHAWAGGFDVALPGKLTEESVLSFSWYEIGCYALDTEYDTISVTFADAAGEETEFWCMTNQNQQTEHQFVEIPLSRFAGKTGGLKLVFWHNGVNYVGDGDIMRFYSPRISNVAIPVIPEARWKTESYATCSEPQILSVKGRDGTEIDEGFYRELGIGEDVLRVRCSSSVTELKAYPSHLTYLADEDVTVEKSGPGEFLVKMDTSKAPRRQRMMLTLEASNSNGDTTYRDLSLRFDNAKSIAQLDRWRKIASFSGQPTDVFTFDDSSKRNSGTGSISIGNGCSEYVESPFGHALYHTAGVDGPWQSSSKPLDLAHEWTVLMIAKTCETNNAVLFQIGSSSTGYNGLALVSGGKNKVTLSYWQSREPHTDCIVSDVNNASSRYHSYAIRVKGLSVELFVDGIPSGSATVPSIPTAGFQFFSVIGGSGKTGLVRGCDDILDDWRMYDVALPDAAIAAYANTLFMFDENRAGVAVEEGGTVVPESWFAKYCPGKTITREQLLAKAANGRSVWECYVAGLDPTDEDDDLIADITFEDGAPKVSLAKGEKASRQYRIWGRKSLSPDEPAVDVTDVEDLSAAGYEDLRFFHITAELP